MNKNSIRGEFWYKISQSDEEVESVSGVEVAEDFKSLIQTEENNYDFESAKDQIEINPNNYNNISKELKLHPVYGFELAKIMLHRGSEHLIDKGLTNDIDFAINLVLYSIEKSLPINMKIFSKELFDSNPEKIFNALKYLLSYKTDTEYYYSHKFFSNIIRHPSYGFEIAKIVISTDPYLYRLIPREIKLNKKYFYELAIEALGFTEKDNFDNFNFLYYIFSETTSSMDLEPVINYILERNINALEHIPKDAFLKCKKATEWSRMFVIKNAFKYKALPSEIKESLEYGPAFAKLALNHSHNYNIYPDIPQNIKESKEFGLELAFLSIEKDEAGTSYVNVPENIKKDPERGFELAKKSLEKCILTNIDKIYPSIPEELRLDDYFGFELAKILFKKIPKLESAIEIVENKFLVEENEYSELFKISLTKNHSNYMYIPDEIKIKLGVDAALIYFLKEEKSIKEKALEKHFFIYPENDNSVEKQMNFVKEEVPQEIFNNEEFQMKLSEISNYDVYEKRNENLTLEQEYEIAVLAVRINSTNYHHISNRVKEKEELHFNICKIVLQNYKYGYGMISETIKSSEKYGVELVNLSRNFNEMSELYKHIPENIRKNKDYGNQWAFEALGDSHQQQYSVYQFIPDEIRDNVENKLILAEMATSQNLENYKFVPEDLKKDGKILLNLINDLRQFDLYKKIEENEDIKKEFIKVFNKLVKTNSVHDTILLLEKNYSKELFLFLEKNIGNFSSKEETFTILKFRKKILNDDSIIQTNKDEDYLNLCYGFYKFFQENYKNYEKDISREDEPKSISDLYVRFLSFNLKNKILYDYIRGIDIEMSEDGKFILLKGKKIDKKEFLKFLNINFKNIESNSLYNPNDIFSIKRYSANKSIPPEVVSVLSKEKMEMARNLSLFGYFENNNDYDDDYDDDDDDDDEDVTNEYIVSFLNKINPSKDQNIKSDKIKIKNFTFEILEKSNPIGIVLGDLTSCCQVVGGASENCILDAYNNPNSGFLAVYDERNKIIAQSWLRLGKSNILYLDNIETIGLYDVRYENSSPQKSLSLSESLKEWSLYIKKKYNYKNIVVGSRYSDLELKKFDDLEQKKNYKNFNIKTDFEVNNIYSDLNKNFEDNYVLSKNKFWYKISSPFGTDPFGAGELSDKVRTSPYGNVGGDSKFGLFEPSSGKSHPNDYFSESKNDAGIEKMLEKKKEKRKKIKDKKRKENKVKSSFIYSLAKESFFELKGEKNSPPIKIAQWGTNGPTMPIWGFGDFVERSYREKANTKNLTNKKNKVKKIGLEREQNPFKKLLQCSVTINSFDNEKIEIGSGFFINNYMILTCFHVAAPSGDIETPKIEINFNENKYIAKIFAYDESLDIAVLIVDGDFQSEHYFPILESEIEQGEEIIVIGTPLGFENIITDGIVTSEKKYVTNEKGSEYFFVSADMSPGNSGGPVLHRKKEAIAGMSAAIIYENEESNAAGLNAAIPSENIKKFLDQNGIKYNKI